MAEGWNEGCALVATPAASGLSVSAAALETACVISACLRMVLVRVRVRVRVRVGVGVRVRVGVGVDQVLTRVDQVLTRY